MLKGLFGGGQKNDSTTVNYYSTSRQGMPTDLWIRVQEQQKIREGRIIERKMMGDESAEKIRLGDPGLEHSGKMFLQDEVDIDRKALEVMREKEREYKLLYLQTGERAYADLLMEVYNDYYEIVDKQRKLGFQVEDFEFVRDDNYYKRLYEIYWREGNFVRWLFTEERAQLLFSESQSYLFAGIGLLGTVAVQNVHTKAMEGFPSHSNVPDSNVPEPEFKGFNISKEGTRSTLGDGICFTGETLILTKDGYKHIKDIEIGNDVYSENPETGEKGLKKVKNVFTNETKEIIHIYLGQEEIKATPNHPFWVEEKGWIAAGELQAGDKVRLYNGNVINVDKTIAKKLEENIKVYNFEVEDWHTYFVSSLQVLVHNTCEMNVYRGGNSFKVKPNEVKIDAETGLLKTTHGVSVNVDASKVSKFGGAYKIESLPEGLKIIQRGADAGHFEIVPAKPMTLNEFQDLLNQIKTSPVN
jgi:hypothetical protein